MTWRTETSEYRTLPTALRSSRLRELKSVLGRGLKRSKERIGRSLRPDWRSISNGIAALTECGDYLMTILFPQNSRMVLEQWNEFTTCEKREGYPLEIVVNGLEGDEGSNLILPFEYLPLFRIPRGLPKMHQVFSSSEQLDTALSVFPGYAAIVGRTIGTVGEIPPRRLLKRADARGEKSLPAKFFTCRTLKGAREEEHRLRQEQKDFLEFDVWPGIEHQGTAQDLAEFLWRISHSTTRKRRKRYDRIHHFASHFKTDSLYPDEHTITLAGCSASRFQVSLLELQAHLGRWKQHGPLPFRGARPLTFVNACGSSQINSHGIGSLPELFLALLGSSGFIGTETKVSDRLATEFASEFYGRISMGASVGRALFDSRRALVMLFNNPVGIFYTSYAHPRLVIKDTL